ncbi:hypothetical protein ACS0TY_005481 [Phlomoides rotata]
MCWVRRCIHLFEIPVHNSPDLPVVLKIVGMGEPLHNIENVIKVANILVDEQGLQFNPRKVTLIFKRGICTVFNNYDSF